MLITQVDIKNFRGIEELRLELDDLCVLIGENNAGKSSVLDALRICLTRSLNRKESIFDEYDYHLTGTVTDPSNTKPIEITLRFQERTQNEWPDEISQILSNAEQIDNNGLRCIVLRVRGYYDSASKNHVSEHAFLDLSDNPLLKAKSPRYIFDLQQLVPTFYLASLRDAAKEFQARSQFWKPFIRALNLDDDIRSDLEKSLLDLNTKVLKQHTAFDAVKERLSNTAKLLPIGDTDPVSIEAIPSRIFDILSRTQINLESKSGAGIPIVRHGSGTQSLAVICLFDAFLQSRLSESYGEHATPLLTLEEPEAHLHPSAIKGVASMLREISGQKLISTHSGDLLASVPLEKIRRLRRKDGRIVVHKIDEGILNEDDRRKVDYHIRATRGDLLFSRCWLLVEGETEATLLPECGLAVDFDFHAEGVCCVEFSQVGINVFIKIADQLGIEWFALVDGDAQGENYMRAATSQLGGRNSQDHIKKLDSGTMEMLLCLHGFGEIYKDSISEQKRDTITEENETSAEYWEQVLNAQEKGAKIRNIPAITKRIIDGEIGIPQQLQDVIERVKSLARGAKQ